MNLFFKGFQNIGVEFCWDGGGGFITFPYTPLFYLMAVVRQTYQIISWTRNQKKSNHFFNAIKYLVWETTGSLTLITAKVIGQVIKMFVMVLVLQLLLESHGTGAVLARLLLLKLRRLLNVAIVGSHREQQCRESRGRAITLSPRQTFTTCPQI